MCIRDRVHPAWFSLAKGKIYIHKTILTNPSNNFNNLSGHVATCERVHRAQLSFKSIKPSVSLGEKTCSAFKKCQWSNDA